jgi:prepilin-type N-terminal cleavage/methylation domain-containing protein
MAIDPNSRVDPALARGHGSRGDSLGNGGFTLLEVMVSMLVGTIGLLGTIAVQQSIISASKNANDAAVAMRLAVQKLDELSSRSTDTQTADATSGLSLIATADPNVWSPTTPEYLDAEGRALRDTGGALLAPKALEMGRFRWHRQWRVFNPVAGSPYLISVIVTYQNDVGVPKTTRVDLERRKTW